MTKGHTITLKPEISIMSLGNFKKALMRKEGNAQESSIIKWKYLHIESCYQENAGGTHEPRQLFSPRADFGTT